MRTGQIISHVLTDDEAKAINKRRADAAETRSKELVHTGWVSHTGSEVHAYDSFPFIVTRVFEDENGVPKISGQVMLDGNDTLWVVVNDPDA